MLARPTPTDCEIASATFNRHLDALWSTGRPGRLGWERQQLDGLHVIVVLPALRQDGKIDHYHVKLGAEFYDAWPPMVNFVVPTTWTEARSGTNDFPVITNPPWFQLHDAYAYPDGVNRQLVCFSRAAQYYQTDHSTPDSTVWHQGTHTVAWTLYGVAEVLCPPYYRGPSA
jgi:hypothetical protein